MWKNPIAMIHREASANSEDLKKLVIEAFGYTDLNGKMRATQLMGMATDKMWTETIRDMHRMFGKEIHAACQGLSKWGAPVSVESVRDIVAKVLMEHKFYPYPDVVAALADKLPDNPVYEKHIVPDYVGDQEKLGDEAK